MIIKSSKNPETIIDIDNMDKFKTQAEKMSIEFILKALNILIDAENKGRWSGEIRLILEIAIIKMVDIEEELSLLERIKRLEEGFVPSREVKKENIRQENIRQDSPTKSVVERAIEKPLIASKIETTEEKHEGESFIDLDLATISNHWDVVLKEIKLKKISLFALIREGKLKDFSNNQLEINYDEGFDFHHGAISKEDNKQLVEDIISKHFNTDIVVDFSLGSIISSKPKEEKTDDDAIKEVVDFFGKDIVEIQ